MNYMNITFTQELITALNEEFQVKSGKFLRLLFISPAANDAMILQEAMEVITYLLGFITVLFNNYLPKAR